MKYMFRSIAFVLLIIAVVALNNPPQQQPIEEGVVALASIYIPVSTSSPTESPTSVPVPTLGIELIMGSVPISMEEIAGILAQNYYGETINVYDHHWVTVVNIDPVFTYNDRQAFGDRCHTGFDRNPTAFGTIQVRGEIDGLTLYEYTTRFHGGGTECIPGVLFFGR